MKKDKKSRDTTEWRREGSREHLKGPCTKDRDRLFSSASCSRTKGNGIEIKDSRFRVDTTFIY